MAALLNFCVYPEVLFPQLGKTRPDLRNPALAVMTESITGAENRYSGIPTIIREMKEYGLPEPVFENRRNEFVVILYNGSKRPMLKSRYEIKIYKKPTL